MMGRQGLGRHSFLRATLGLVLLAGLLAAATAAVRSQPPPPMLRYGRAFINFNPEGARDGTLVEVESFLDPGGWTLVASDLTETIGGEKGWYGKPEALEIEGEGGVQVRYSVAGKEAIESPKDWDSGTSRQDLNIRLAWLGTEVSAPEGANVDTEFEVSAIITNTGLIMARNVKAVLTVSEGAHLAAGEVATKTVGVMGYLPAGDVDEVTWTLACTATVPVTITVAPSGTDDSTGDPIDEYYAVSDTAVVEQETPAYMVANILTPSQGEMVGVGDPLIVTVSISNTGQADAVDVTAALTHTAGAELVSSGVQAVGEIPGGAAGVASWTVVCTDARPVTMTVMPQGTDGNDGGPVPSVPGNVVVEPYDPPYLTTVIQAVGHYVPVGEAFGLSATITNTGLGAADGVTALIDVRGSAVLTATDAPSQTVGALSAGEGQVLAWTAVVTDTGPITVAVAPDGLDAASGYPIPEARRPPDTLVLPQLQYRLFLVLLLKAAEY